MPCDLILTWSHLVLAMPIYAYHLQVKAQGTDGSTSSKDSKSNIAPSCRLGPVSRCWRSF